MAKYSIGIDFGTLSARAVAVDIENGRMKGNSKVFDYPHGVMTELFGKALPDTYALQHPQDYIDALDLLIPALIRENSIDPNDIVGIAIDFTACTVFPLSSDGTPLCFYERYKNEPHAYAKLWKHAGANKYAKKIEEAARKHSDMLKLTGNMMSGEFMYPKLYETYVEAPHIYAEAARFVNAGDYLSSLLVGRYVHSTAYATIKEHYDNSEHGGYPPREFFAEIDEGFAKVLDKTGTELDGVGDCCGYLTEEWAERLGLTQNTAIAVPIVDAHGPLGIMGIEDGKAVAALGTSAVMAVLSSKYIYIDGVLSIGREASAEGLTTYEAGIRAMGDLYAWFINNCLPAEYIARAEELGMNIHAYLRSLAQKKKIGETGLIALDWWNGNRSVIPNDKLSGMILGMRLSTKPEDIYRAIIEATVFELRRVYANYVSQGIEIKSFVAAGGIAAKDPMLMQMLADALNMDIDCLTVKEATALGTSVWGAVAAGCYETLEEASAKMRAPIDKTYRPIPENVEKYEVLYQKYSELYDYFAKENKVMEFLYDFKYEN